MNRLRTTNRLALALASAAAGALALGACGGSSGAGGLSKAQLAARVNPICADLGTQAGKLTVPPDFQTNAPAAAAYLDKLVAISNGELAKLEALEPEAKVAADYRAYVQTLVHEVSLLQTGAAKAHAADPSGLADLRAEGQYAKQVSNPMAARLGFTSCAT